MQYFIFLGHFARQMYSDNEKAGECMNLPPKGTRVRSYELESPSTIYTTTVTAGRPRKQKYYELDDSSSQADDPDEIETQKPSKKSDESPFDKNSVISDKEKTKKSTLLMESLSGFQKECDEEIEHWKNKKTDDEDELSEEALKLLEEVKTVFSTLNNNGEC